jgi:hypothetical protein
MAHHLGRMSVSHRIKIVSIIVTGAAGLPFLFLAFCQHPMGLHEWDWIMGYPDEVGGLDFWAAQQYWYEQVMGRFVSTAITSLAPYWYTLSRFQTLLALLVVLLPLCLYSVVRVVLESSSAILWTSVLTLAYWCAISGVYDSLFRFSSVLTYQIGLLGWLIWMAAWSKSLNGSRLYLSLAVFALLFAVGTNEITLLLSGIVLLAVGWSQRFHSSRYFYLFAVVWAVFAAIVLLAPGNFNRAGQYTTEVPLLKCIMLWGATSLFTLIDWLSDGILLPVLVLWGYTLYRWPLKTAHEPVFRFPKVWLLATLAVVPAGLFLVVVGTRAASFPERVVDLLFLPFALGCMGTILSFYLKYQQQQRTVVNLPEWMFLVIAFYTVGHAFFAGLSLNRNDKSPRNYLSLIQVNSPVGQAWLTVLTGQAKQYDLEMSAQYEIIRAAAQDTVWVNPPSVRPILLYDSLSDRRWRPSGELYMGRYFNDRVKSVQYKAEHEHGDVEN